MSKEAMKLALDAHHKNESHRTVAETKYWCHQYKWLAHQAIKALAEQPAQQEPVKHELQCICGCSWEIDADGNEELVSSPPAQRKPLTHEQAKALVAKYGNDPLNLVFQTEAAHGIKGDA